MGELSELLTVEAHVKHVEGAGLVEVGHVGNIAADGFVVVGALSTDPVGILLSPFLVRLTLLSQVGILETDGDVVDVGQESRVQRHEQLGLTPSQYRSAVGLDTLNLGLRG